MIKKTWKKALAGLCAAAMVVTSVGPAAIESHAGTESNETHKVYYPLNKMTAIADSQYNGGNANEGPATYVLDGSPNTHWHTNYNTSEGSVEANRWIGVELAKETEITGIEYLPRTNGGTNGAVTKFKAEYRETTDGEWKEITTGDWDKSSTEWQRIEFDAVTAKQVRVVGVHTYADSGNDAHMSCAEFRVTMDGAKIENDVMTVDASSVDTSEAAFDKSASKAIDEDANTFWATVPGGKLSDAHYTVELEQHYVINKVTYTKRYDSGAKWGCTGNLLDYIIEVSVDGDTWTQVATGATVDGTTEIRFNEVDARYVRVRATQSYHWKNDQKNTVMTIAELGIYGTPIAVEIDPAEDPTCTETGLTEGTHCSLCKEVIKVQEERDALGHTEETYAEAEDPTCTETGLTEGKQCTVCNEVTAEQKATSALGHAEVIIPAEKPTYTKTGLTEGIKCSVCGKVIVAQKEIPMKEAKKLTVWGQEGSSVDTSEPAHNKDAANATDGNPNTFWATVPGGTLADAYYIVELDQQCMVDRVDYTKRYDSGAKWGCTGNLLDYIIEVSTDGEIWEKVANGATVDGTTQITFDEVKAKYIKITATQSYHWQSSSKNTVMTIAELDVYGTPVPAAEFKEASATLTGTIGLNFYVQVNDAEELDALSVRLTSSKKGSKPITEELKTITAVKSGNRAGWYKVTYNVAAKEMTDVITAEIIKDGDVIVSTAESVKTYALKAKEYYKDDTNLGVLIDALLNYGAVAQHQFAYKTTEEGLSSLDELKALYVDTVIDPDADFVEDTNTKTAMAITKGEGFPTAEVDISQVSLLLKEDTVLRLYLKVASGVDMSGYKVTPELVSGKKYAEEKGISAQKLEDRITFTITAPNGAEATVVYSPLDYAKAVVDSDKTDDTLKTVAKALYEYYVCAETYFANR